MVIVKLSLARIAILCTVLPAARSFSSPSKPPSPPKPPPKNLTPDDRQAEVLQKMGYTWNGKSWVRGDVKRYQQQRATARSSNRSVRFVDAQDRNQPASSEAAVAAAKRLEQVLSQARQDVMMRTSEQASRDRDFKNFCQQRRAPILWLGAEILAFVALCQAVVRVPMANGAVVAVDLGREWQQLNSVENPLLVAACSISAGMVLSQCRATNRSFLPGVEEQDGKLPRILADTIAERSIALPAPNHIRYSSRNWRILATIGETIGAVNVSLLMNGILQPVLIRTGSDAFVWRTIAALSSSSSSSSSSTDDVAMTNAFVIMGALGAAALTAVPAGVRAAQNSGEPWDGIRAECEAVVRNKRTAGAYFNMDQRKAGGDPLQATEAFQLLADGWLEKFEGVSVGAEWKQPLLAFTGSLACALAFQASGGLLVAPFLARLLAAVDTYLIRDEKEMSRKNVVLDLK